MKDKNLTNVAASVRQRLLNLSVSKGVDFNALLAQYAIERFLYRLSKSALADRFVLKGAMLFRVWAADLHRPTKDLDLLGFGEHTPDAVAAAIKKIVATTVPDDGLLFDETSVTAAEIREEQEYGGIRVKLVAKLGSARIPMQVDVGFGDAVVPKAKLELFPALLDQDAARVRMYSPETVVAEKLEAIVTLGIANSRMKDFYDLLVIFRMYELNNETLAEALVATFHRRQTPIPAEAPVGLSDEFGRDPVARRRWTEFLRRLQIKDAPRELVEVIDAIWARMSIPIAKARS